MLKPTRFYLDECAEFTDDIWDKLQSRGVNKDASIGIMETRKSFFSAAMNHFKGRLQKRCAMYLYIKKVRLIQQEGKRENFYAQFLQNYREMIGGTQESKITLPL